VAGRLVNVVSSYFSIVHTISTNALTNLAYSNWAILLFTCLELICTAMQLATSLTTNSPQLVLGTGWNSAPHIRFGDGESFTFFLSCCAEPNGRDAARWKAYVLRQSNYCGWRLLLLRLSLWCAYRSSVDIQNLLPHMTHPSNVLLNRRVSAWNSSPSSLVKSKSVASFNPPNTQPILRRCVPRGVLDLSSYTR